MKMRVVPESNYKSIWDKSGKTIRWCLDPSKPITDLKYPEFYDIKITNTCKAGCKWCYQNSTADAETYGDIVGKLKTFLDTIPKDQKPYQIAFGGGEPTSAKEFNDIIKLTFNEGICPNFTTNGMWTVEMSQREREEHLETCRNYVGGIAVSAHPHLEHYWRTAIAEYSNIFARINIHLIISDKRSIDRAMKIIDEYHNDVEFFVFLPYSNVGRAEKNPKEIDIEYLIEHYPTDEKIRRQISYGAMFYPYLLQGKIPGNYSLYEPDIMSKYLDLMGTGYLYPSSFSTEVLQDNFFSK